MSTNKKQKRWLRELCLAFTGYDGHDPYQDVLMPWFFDLMEVLTELSPYRRLNTPANDYPVTDDDLYQWYALSRLNDCLIAGFRHDADFYDAERQQDETWREWMSNRRASVMGRRWYPLVPIEHYNDFFLALGFGPLGYSPYHPFHHEIVEVVEDAEWQQQPGVEQVFWPGWMFGEMLFARAGVRVRCSPGTFDKQIAETSRMYFTYRRNRREAEDLSHGWGHNSQWITTFRRDYDSNGGYHFNVDGTHPLGDDSLYKASFEETEWKILLEEEAELTEDGLTRAERIEHLVNRCFVRCRKSDGNRWPYDDTYTILKP